mgnify:CR=1 FL=1
MDKKNLIQGRWRTGILDELKRVTWPTKKQTIRLTMVVIVISLIIGIYIGIIDVLLAKLLEFLTLKR